MTFTAESSAMFVEGCLIVLGIVLVITIIGIVAFRSNRRKVEKEIEEMHQQQNMNQNPNLQFGNQPNQINQNNQQNNN